jgi:hypothetical protein
VEQAHKLQQVELVMETLAVLALKMAQAAVVVQVQ